jgi:hypothetical protein
MLEIASFLSLRITAAVVVFFARRILGAPIGRLRSIIVRATDAVDAWLLEREIGQLMIPYRAGAGQTAEVTPSVLAGHGRPPHAPMGGSVRNQRQRVVRDLESKPLVEREILASCRGQVAGLAGLIGPGEARRHETGADSAALRILPDAERLQIPMWIRRM